MRWFAYLSNGEVVGEQDEPDDVSTWRKLMARCERDGLCLVNLCLVVNGIPSWCRPNAPGYWQAKSAFVVTGAAMHDPGTGGLLPPGTYRRTGVGWVEGGLLHTIWGHMDGQITRDAPRPIIGERQIIWAPPFRRAHGGADERLVIEDGRAWRESDGELVVRPEPRAEPDRLGLTIGETD